jgi:putative membrane protein
VAHVPLLIGLNWSMLVFAFGVPLSRMRWPIWTKVLVGSLSMVALDLLIEPVAVHLGFWTWEGGNIPTRNYIAWGGVSAVLFSCYFLAPVSRRNPMAASVLLAQVLFFAGLNLVLGSA